MWLKSSLLGHVGKTGDQLIGCDIREINVWFFNVMWAALKADGMTPC